MKILNIKKNILFILFLTFVSNLFATDYTNLREILDELDRLPEFTQDKKDEEIRFLSCLPLLKMSYNNFSNLTNIFLEKKMESLCIGDDNWLNFGYVNFLNAPDQISYMQKIYVPEDSQICVMGDIHGSIQSLSSNIRELVENGAYLDCESFRITKENFYLVFLGDYTDRVLYGIEVLYLILKIAVANPGKVFLLKGNHEECSSRDNGLMEDYGFKLECEIKYPGTDLFEKIKSLYRNLPVALFIGVQNDSELDIEQGHKESSDEFILCNHGGVNIGICAEIDNFFLKNKNKKFCSISDLQAKPFLWSDYDQYKKGNTFDTYTSSFRTEFNPERGPLAEHISAAFMEEILKASSIKAIFRGHQHSKYGLKMLFKSELLAENFHYVIPENLNNPNIQFSGLYHWKDVVTRADINNSEFIIGNYLPIFTLSTACAPLVFSDNKYDCYVFLNIKKRISNSNLQVCESHHNPDDEESSGDTELDDLFLFDSDEPDSGNFGQVEDHSSMQSTTTATSLSEDLD
ncbi:metallophosphoesterase [Candidatus Babeliales bacterium]|nr:metallophosphoesterase [Candidatus Babeliales bacterium]